MLFQALTGQVPFPRPSEVAKIYAHLSEPFPSLTGIRPDLPPALEAVVGRATARSPDDRYETAAELAQALSLAGAASTRAAAAPPSPPPQATAPSEPPVPSTPTVPAAEPKPATPTVPAAAERPITAPTTTMPARRRRGLVLAAGGVAVVVGAAALIASGALSGGGSGGGTILHEKTQAASGAGAAQSTAAPTLVPYSSSDLVANVPAKWRRQSSARGSLTRNEWTDPADSSTSVLVDAVGPSAVDARASRNRDRGSGQPGYQEVAFAPTTLAGQPAYAWEYRLPDKQRIDYFVNRCDAGYAIQGTAPQARFAALKQMFRRVAQSVQPPGCQG
jgi:hypothetical protein